MYLYDTDTLSNVMKPEPSSRLLARMAGLPSERQFTTTITVGEMVYGAHRSSGVDRYMRKIETLLRQTTILPFDRLSAEIYGRIRAELDSAGTPLAEPDLRIAAIAMSREFTVVTGNVRHFERVPGLKVDNWL